MSRMYLSPFPFFFLFLLFFFYANVIIVISFIIFVFSTPLSYSCLCLCLCTCTCTCMCKFSIVCAWREERRAAENKAKERNRTKRKWTSRCPTGREKRSVPNVKSANMGESECKQQEDEKEIEKEDLFCSYIWSVNLLAITYIAICFCVRIGEAITWFLSFFRSFCILSSPCRI